MAKQAPMDMGIMALIGKKAPAEPSSPKLDLAEDRLDKKMGIKEPKELPVKAPKPKVKSKSKTKAKARPAAALTRKPVKPMLKLKY